MTGYKLIRNPSSTEYNMMIRPLKYLSVLLLVMAAGAPVHAEGRGGSERRADREQLRALSREVQRPGRDYNPRATDDGLPGGQRNGRMSLEERRALRRQINEVNQDIYSRPRH